ncbi:hypothetical protein TNCT_352731 [Trichonephila clavata]|uniref:Uncharacterized protein n=1 Tax=Trichonephila clavata TaxID=2740835 RepID=A0A8X6KWN0_TRICU|nr:hypothetical protein TNCT_352731 [Trichonephila clavata]
MDGGDDDKRVEPADIIDLPRKSREFGEVGSLPISSSSLQLLLSKYLAKTDNGMEETSTRRANYTDIFCSLRHKTTPLHPKAHLVPLIGSPPSRNKAK